MTTLLIALLFSLVLPLFISTWRIAVLGLALQGAILTLIAYHADSSLTLDNLVTLVDLVVVRSLLGPLAMYRSVRTAATASGHDVNPPNILSWTLALALVLLAFRVAARLVPEAGDDQTFVAVTVSAILLAFLRLATQAGPGLQMIAALRIENAIALFELDQRHGQSLPLRCALLALTVATIIFFRWYLSTMSDVAAETREAPAL